MRAYVVMLNLLVVALIPIQPAIAEKFSIYAYDKESNTLLQNVYIRVWEGSSLLDSGITDKHGVFVTNLIDGRKYRIRAEYYNEWDEINNTANSINSNRINLNLHK